MLRETDVTDPVERTAGGTNGFRENRPTPEDGWEETTKTSSNRTGRHRGRDKGVVRRL